MFGQLNRLVFQEFWRETSAMPRNSEYERDLLIIALLAVAEAEVRWQEWPESLRKRLGQAAVKNARDQALKVIKDEKLVDEMLKKLDRSGGRQPYGTGRKAESEVKDGIVRWTKPEDKRATPGLEAVCEAMRELGLSPPVPSSLFKVFNRRVASPEGGTALDAYLGLIFAMVGVPMSEVAARMDAYDARHKSKSGS